MIFEGKHAGLLDVDKGHIFWIEAPFPKEPVFQSDPLVVTGFADEIQMAAGARSNQGPI
jgi:hypothetical protein